MTRTHTSRRTFLKTTAAGAASALLPLPANAQGVGGRVVVIGGGFGGATCARFLKRIDPRITVTLVEASQTFTARSSAIACVTFTGASAAYGEQRSPSRRIHGQACPESRRTSHLVMATQYSNSDGASR